MLTAEQKQRIEENIWVVNAVLKRLKLSEDNDLRQTAILYLCKCAERFEPSNCVKFSTYAYKSLYFYCKRTYARQKENEKKFVSLEVVGYSCPAPSATQSEGIARYLAAKERKVLVLFNEGYSKKEVAKMLCIKTRELNEIVKQIKIVYNNIRAKNL